MSSYTRPSTYRPVHVYGQEGRSLWVESLCQASGRPGRFIPEQRPYRETGNTHDGLEDVPYGCQRFETRLTSHSLSHNPQRGHASSTLIRIVSRGRLEVVQRSHLQEGSARYPVVSKLAGLRLATHHLRREHCVAGAIEVVRHSCLSPAVLSV